MSPISLGVYGGAHRQKPPAVWIGETDTPPPGAHALVVYVGVGSGVPPATEMVGTTDATLIYDLWSGSVTTPCARMFFAESPDGTAMSPFSNQTALSRHVFWMTGLYPELIKGGRNTANATPSAFTPDPLPHLITLAPDDVLFSMLSGRGFTPDESTALHDHFYYGQEYYSITRGTAWTAGTDVPDTYDWPIARYAGEWNLVLSRAGTMHLGGA